MSGSKRMLDFEEGLEDSLVTFVLQLSGDLPYNRRLRHSVLLTVVFDPEEVVIADHRFHMHAATPTFAEAELAFRRMLSG
jgi:hypothetical protein